LHPYGRSAPICRYIYIDDNGQIRYGTTTPASNAAPSLSGIILDLNVKRSKRFVGLTPGVTYYVVYYVANAKGVSELSDPVGLLCG
jgi:hypothetical protein